MTNLKRFVVLLSFGLAAALPVLACGNHGVIGGNMIQSWINSNVTGNGSGGMTVAASGTQTNQGGSPASNPNQTLGSPGNAGWNANAWYQVTVTFPDGTSHTILAYPNSASGGADMEYNLRDAGIAAIQDWFSKNGPKTEQNTASTKFIG